MRFGRGEGVIGWVVENEMVAHVEETKEDPRFLKRTGQPFHVRSILAVPLWSAGHVVGVLAVSSDRPRVFSDQDELLTRLLSNCAVPAFERARLERLAITDAHTLAFNRRYLVPRLEEEMSRLGRTGGSLSLMLLDLDHFKRVNDEHGHSEGDRVLRGFADRVRLETRRQDALVRWGGEEFVLIMPDTDLEMARHVAERIRAAVANRPFELGDGSQLRQTVSIGVANWDRRETPQQLEDRADAAMYGAKESGRNRVQVAQACPDCA
jgi:diguanylate cyclase (GGDEF)-like protein